MRGRQYRSGGGVSFFVAGVVLLLVGLGAVGAGLVDRVPLRQQIPAAAYLPAVAASPRFAASPLATLAAFRGNPSCLLGSTVDPRPDATAPVVIDEDPRHYLSKMAGLRYLDPATASAPDPYQASLNPSVFLTGDVMTAAIAAGSRQDAPGQDCGFP